MNFKLRNFAQRLLGASPEASSFMSVSSEQHAETPLSRLMHDQERAQEVKPVTVDTSQHTQDDIEDVGVYDQLTETMAVDPTDQETFAVSTQIFNRYKDMKLPLNQVVDHFDGKAYMLINSRWLIEIMAKREGTHYIGSHRLLRIGSPIAKELVLQELSEIFQDLVQQDSIDWCGTGALQSNAQIDALQELLNWHQSDHSPFGEMEPWQDYWLNSMITILIHTNENARMGYKIYVATHGEHVPTYEQRQKQIKHLLESAATTVTEI